MAHEVSARTAQLHATLELAMLRGVTPALVLGLSACNQFYGIEKTRPLPDAPEEFFDVREDFECPPIGQTPRFGTTLTTVQQMCREYNRSVDGTIATAFCGSPMQPSAGPIDGPLAPIAGLSNSTVLPRLAPEGDELFVRENPSGNVQVYRRGSDYTFAASHMLTAPFSSVDIRIGTPSLGPMRRMFVGSPSNMPQEIVIAPDGTSTLVHTYVSGELLTGFLIAAPNMTPDGLRIVFPARDTVNNVSQMMYADRADINMQFTAARVLENVPYIADNVFLDEHCSRLYSTATSGPVDSVVWLQRLEDP